MGDAPEFHVMLTPQMLFCPEHLLPFKADWPRGYPGAMMCLFHQAVNHDEEIRQAAGMRTESLEAAIREYGPICCRLDPDVLRDITEGCLSLEEGVMVDTVKKYGPPPGPPPA